MIMPRRVPMLHGLRRRWQTPPWLRALLAGMGILMALYILSPYLALWRLDHTIATRPPAALSGLVDIAAVREEILRRLNKDSASRIGEVSDPFIEWLQRALRESGDDALAGTVTLEWLYDLLASRGDADAHLLGAVSHAFFDGPTDFRVRIGTTNPVHLHLEPHWLGWRVTAVYY